MIDYLYKKFTMQIISSCGQVHILISLTQTVSCLPILDFLLAITCIILITQVCVSTSSFSGQWIPYYYHLWQYAVFHPFQVPIPYSFYCTQYKIVSFLFTFVFQSFFLKFYLIGCVVLNFYLYMFRNHMEKWLPKQILLLVPIIFCP